MSQKGYALITGATSGIGLELAKLFAEDEFNLVLVARDEAALQSVASTLKNDRTEVVTIAKDLSQRGEVKALCEEISNRALFIEVLVNDAGQGVYGKFEYTDVERELYLIDLNIVSVVMLTKYFLKEMLAKKSGKILNLASIASTTPGPWQSVYHGTKAFILSFSEAVREEIKGTGVTLTALMPGATDTDFFNKADMTESKVVQDKDSLSAAADVARDGYEALMSGKDKVVSGFKNKLQVAMTNITPDGMLARQMGEMQKPVSE